MRLNRLALIAIGVASALIAAAISASVERLGAPTRVTVGATVGVFYLTAYALANATATFRAHLAARRGRA